MGKPPASFGLTSQRDSHPCSSALFAGVICPIPGTHPFGAAASSVQICSRQICPCPLTLPSLLVGNIPDCAQRQKPIQNHGF
ncbi:hypothetical protein A6J66_002805 [Yersinia enterocolitica]|nr:hypothetical protein A6J66_002805 [Yersinia enterocolitica]